MNKNNLRVASAIILSGLGMLVNYLISFLLAPYITETIGIEAYGFVSIAKNFVNCAQIATIAITSFVVRYISVSYHENRIKEANEYYATSIVACAVLAGVVLLIATGIIAKLELLLNIPDELVVSVKCLFLFVFLNLVVTTVTTPFTTGAYIKNRLDIDGLIKIVTYIVNAAVVIILYSSFTPSVCFVGVGSLAGACVAFLCTFALSKKLVPELFYKKEMFSIIKLKNLLKNGVWTSLNSLGNELNSGLDLIISNLFLNGIVTGQISVVKTIGGIFSTLYQIVYLPFQPNLIKAYASGNTENFLSEQKKAMIICGYFSNVAIAGFVALGPLYYRLWLPSQDTRFLYLLSVAAISGGVTAGVMRPIYYVYVLTLKNQLPCWITIFGGLLNIGSMYLLLKYTDLGAYAIVMTTTVIMVSINLFFNPVYAARNLKINVKVYYKIIFRHMFSAGIMAAVFQMVVRWTKPQGWTGLIVNALFMCVIGLFIHVVIMCGRDGKKSLRAI